VINDLPSGWDAAMSICGDLNCSKCCHDREVVLTHDDVDRLLTMGHYEQTFARPSRHGHNLKELIFENGTCIFLKDGKCSVYQNRPTACRIFPYVTEDGKDAIDSGCPHGDIFRKDEIFISTGRDGFKHIIKDVERTISTAIE